MKRFLLVITIFISCTFFIGAIDNTAPVLPTNNFFINDYANVLDEQIRDSMLKAAKKLEAETGVQVVVLTVDGLGDRTLETYAKSIFNGWDIGGSEKKGALILLDTSSKQVISLSGNGIKLDIAYKTSKNSALEGHFSDAVTSQFFAIIGNVYSITEHSVNSERGTEISQGAQSTKGTAKKLNIFYIVSIVLFLFIAMRGMRTSAKYRKKYKKPQYREHQTFTNTNSCFSRHDDDEYPSGFGGLGTRAVIRGEEADDAGIIKRRDDDDDDENKIEIVDWEDKKRR